MRVDSWPAQHFAFTGGQLRQLRDVAGRGCGLAQLCQLFDDASAEPGRVLHHRLDRGKQFGLGAFAFGDVLHHDQQAALAADHHRFGRHQAVQLAAVLRA
ncbi:hypothetical protein G6F35_017962 [Rhizopus arrhizus]|nr:hypothetical protein G6F35_017962 [Rhizopus arrhizus]